MDDNVSFSTCGLDLRAEVKNCSCDLFFILLIFLHAFFLAKYQCCCSPWYGFVYLSTTASVIRWGMQYHGTACLPVRPPPREFVANVAIPVVLNRPIIKSDLRSDPSTGGTMSLFIPETRTCISRPRKVPVPPRPNLPPHPY